MRLPSYNKGSEYALLQMKYARENKLKEATVHRAKARIVEDYTRASNRNNLEVERQNLNSSIQRMLHGLQQYYLDRINDLTTQNRHIKKMFPTIPKSLRRVLTILSYLFERRGEENM